MTYQPGPSPQFPTHDVSFSSGGTTCRAWLTFPDETTGRRVPLVVMAHGFAATRGMGLLPFASRFHAAGMATLIFDYRTFGASDGEPRNCVRPSHEVADWLAALGYARTLSRVDVQRIALWGSSFSGGLVVSAAAHDGDVAATVSQCPMMDGRAAVLEIARYAGLGGLARVTAHGMLDLLRQAVGASPHYMPIVGHPGEVAAMSSPDAWDGYMSLVEPGFRNEVTARTALLVPWYRPIAVAASVKCPALLQICEHDTVAPPAAVEAAAQRMKRAEVVRYPVGHFDVYAGEAFERSVSDQLGFLRRHLLS